MDRRAFIGTVAGGLLAAPLAADAPNEAWVALAKGGHVALIRHGNAPPGYGGDPPGFRFDDCKTQRNLDDAGREQAKALGEAFRKHGVAVETSWTLLPDTGSSAIRVLELEEMVSSWRGPGTLVLVTHALTVGRLTGFTLEQAETLVLQPTPEKLPVGHLPRGGRLAGRIPPPQ